jgi:hypothetical protein
MFVSHNFPFRCFKLAVKQYNIIIIDDVLLLLLLLLLLIIIIIIIIIINVMALWHNEGIFGTSELQGAPSSHRNEES